MRSLPKPLSRWLAPVLWLASLAAPAMAETPSPEAKSTQFVRYIEDSAGGAMLETAAVTYRHPETGVAVTLVGAIHIADIQYFRGLDESFNHYDAVLYEMVKPRNPAAGGKRSGGIAFIGSMQRFMRDNLALEFQLEQINYDNRPNFVHADLDSETFLQKQDERNEGFVRMFFRAVLRESARTSAGGQPSAQLTLPELLAALKAPDRPRQLKLLLARQMQDLEKQMSLFDGEDGSVIITERNKHAFEVLDTVIGQGHKNVAIFYGAGHFPDMEKRLLAMGYEPAGITWRTAWDMRAPPAPATQPAAK